MPVLVRRMGFFGAIGPRTNIGFATTPRNPSRTAGFHPQSPQSTRNLPQNKNWMAVLSPSGPTAGAWGHTPESTPVAGGTEKGGFLPQSVDQITVRRRRKHPPCKSFRLVRCDGQCERICPRMVGGIYVYNSPREWETPRAANLRQRAANANRLYLHYWEI